MQKKKVLIISEDIDFCVVMQFYFSKRQMNVACVQMLQEGLAIVELERPEVILLEDGRDKKSRLVLEDTIRTMSDYQPEIRPVTNQY